MIVLGEGSLVIWIPACAGMTLGCYFIADPLAQMVHGYENVKVVIVVKTGIHPKQKSMAVIPVKTGIQATHHTL